MKKQKLQFILLAAVCLICIGGYFIIKNMEFAEEETTVETVVTDFSKDDVTELTVTGDHELHFVREDDVWTETSLPDETIRESSVNYLISEINHITTTETVVESPEELSQYGLEEPLRTITAVLSDGSSVTIYVGKESSLLSKHYIQVEGDPNVYLAASYIVNAFEEDAEYFVEEEETETGTEEAETETEEVGTTETETMEAETEE